ncbi:hypothetical protein HA466_0229280 [Hirschfeldia incana]|nr:hypothetical protein HA466_0229280 [Hirschfeldia incana]
MLAHTRWTTSNIHGLISNIYIGFQEWMDNRCFIETQRLVKTAFTMASGNVRLVNLRLGFFINTKLKLVVGASPPGDHRASCRCFATLSNAVTASPPHQSAAVSAVFSSRRHHISIVRLEAHDKRLGPRALG